jgi:hypothetical protein
MEGKGIYTHRESDYNVIIEYQLYWDEGSYDVSPESELTIISVKLDAFEDKGCGCSEVDITSIYHDHMDDSWISQSLWEHAWNNKDNN